MMEQKAMQPWDHVPPLCLCLAAEPAEPAAVGFVGALCPPGPANLSYSAGLLLPGVRQGSSDLLPLDPSPTGLHQQSLVEPCRCCLWAAERQLHMYSVMQKLC
uniref:Uncharacterized protein n=1 Tax=Micrurus spixii TaxID=129469 RepID=A0A2D4MFQ4_9SAUR